jgi:hypothetical protein
MTDGVIYFNVGTKCLHRLAVSLRSMRRIHSGPCAALCADECPRWFAELARALDVELRAFDPEGLPPLVLKARLHRHSPFDRSLFIDADTLVTGRFDELFDLIGEYGFAVGRFAGWRTKGRTIASRIAAMAPACGPAMVAAALAYGPAVNTGVFGFTKDSKFLEPWADLTLRAHELGCSRIPDELACQMLLPAIRSATFDERYGESVKFGKLGPTTRIVHYHGRKHAQGFPACGEWKRAYWELMAECTDEVRAGLAADLGDKTLRNYRRREALTFVTAVDPGYLASLRANFPLMAEVAGIAGEPWICYVNGIPIDDPRLDFLKGRALVRAWDFDAPTQRERMLTCFVKAAPFDVKTPRWVKVDADVRPSGAAFKFEAGWRGAALVGHRWHYTKPGRWLRGLEEWADAHPGFAGSARLFTAGHLVDADAQLRYGHPRIASFMCAHDTAFTRRCAELAGPGRLPVPSHDTFLWYCAARLGEPIARTNFKKKGFHP